MEYSLREIECFIAVAEERSFTRAAKRLHLAQPPLSRHIRVLEDKIGAALFIRGRSGVTVTDAGKAFYDEIRFIPQRLIRASEAARRQAVAETARLRLGFVSAVMNEDLTAIFRTFRLTHPSIYIALHDMAPQEQLAALSEGQLDGGFIGLAPETRQTGLHFIAWRKEPLVCLMPQDHPLAKKSIISPKELAAESFIMVSSASAPAFAAHVREICAHAGFRPRVILESPRAQAVALMVAAGSGIALLPVTLARLVAPSVRALTLRPAATITHTFAYRKVKTVSPLILFLQTLRNHTRHPKPLLK